MSTICGIRCLLRRIMRHQETGVLLNRCANYGSTAKTGGGTSSTTDESTTGEKDSSKALNSCATVCSCSSPTGEGGSTTSPSSQTMYDCRKYSHNLPAETIVPCFEPLPYIPTGVFRDTSGEILGPGASKAGPYYCPEYFAFHHNTYSDMHVMLRQYRNPPTVFPRKP